MELQCFVHFNQSKQCHVCQNAITATFKLQFVLVTAPDFNWLLITFRRNLKQLYPEIIQREKIITRVDPI